MCFGGRISKLRKNMFVQIHGATFRYPSCGRTCLSKYMALHSDIQVAEEHVCPNIWRYIQISKLRKNMFVQIHGATFRYPSCGRTCLSKYMALHSDIQVAEEHVCPNTWRYIQISKLRKKMFVQIHGATFRYLSCGRTCLSK